MLGAGVASQSAERSDSTAENTGPAEAEPADVAAAAVPAGQGAGHPAHGHRRQGEHAARRLERPVDAAPAHPRGAVRRRGVRHAALPIRLPPAAEMLPARAVQERQLAAPIPNNSVRSGLGFTTSALYTDSLLFCCFSSIVAPNSNIL